MRSLILLLQVSSTYHIVNIM